MTRATNPSIPSHEEWIVAAKSADPEIEAQFADQLALLDEIGADQYWQELSGKFRPHFYAAVTLLTVGVLEAGLTRLARHLQSGRRRVPISPGQVKGSTLDQFRTFAAIMKWPLPPADSWKWVADLYQVRHALIHDAGSIYAASQKDLERRSQQLMAIVRRCPGLELESVYPEPDIRQLFAELDDRHRSRKPVRAEGVIIRVQQEFCKMALVQTRTLLRELYAPLLEPKRRKPRLTRRHGRRK